MLLLGVLAAQAEGAVAGAGAYDLLETVEITVDGTAFSFTGLGSYAGTYQHLQLRITAGDNDGIQTLNDINLRFNNDAGTYANHVLSGNGSSVSSSDFTSDTHLRIRNVIGRDAANYVYGAAVVDILDFASTTKNKTVRSLIGGYEASEKNISLSSGFWDDTSAVTSIDQVLSVLGVGSRVSLYGLKAA